MSLPPAKTAALFVIRMLREHGHQALLAGGCVRDMLLGLESSDYDVATDAGPERVAEIFHRVLLLGARFGVAVVLYRKQQVEVATFRSDVSYSDGRRPDRVEFSNPREDALRRDFTINGMFYDPQTDEVIDYVGGKEDLAAGIVRTIGEPDRRFGEDYLRMLRAPRFAVRFDFRIDEQTARAIRENAPKIASISGERICDELTKMLSADSAARAAEQLEALQLAPAILPELFADRDLLWARGLARLAVTAPQVDVVNNFAARLAELPIRSIRRIARRWGMSNQLSEAICFCAAHLDQLSAAAGPMPLADLKRLLADTNFPHLQSLWRAAESVDTGRTTESGRLEMRIRQIPPETIDPPELIDGHELMEMGLKQGPRIGQILRAVRDAQLNEQIEAPGQARDLARRLIDESSDSSA